MPFATSDMKKTFGLMTLLGLALVTARARAADVDVAPARKVPTLTLAEALRTARTEQPTLRQAQSARLAAAAQAESAR